MKGNARLLNASVARRMRELRLDVAGRIYASAVGALDPHEVDLGRVAQASIKAAQALLDADQALNTPAPIPGDPLHPAAREALAAWMELVDAVARDVPIGRQEWDRLMHTMGNRMQTLASHVRGEPS